MNSAATVSIVTIGAAELEQRIESAVRRAIDNHASMPIEWFTTNQAAEFLGIHVRTVTKLAFSGELPGSRIGKLWRFERKALEKWIADRGSHRGK